MIQRNNLDIEQEKLFNGKEPNMIHEHCDDIKVISKIVLGNGVKGLAEKVEEHESYIAKQIGSLSAIKWLLGAVGVGEITLLLKAFIG
jgi:hypothetical protein